MVNQESLRETVSQLAEAVLFGAAVGWGTSLWEPSYKWFKQRFNVDLVAARNSILTGITIGVCAGVLLSDVHLGLVSGAVASCVHGLIKYTDHKYGRMRVWAKY